MDLFHYSLLSKPPQNTCTFQQFGLDILFYPNIKNTPKTVATPLLCIHEQHMISPTYVFIAAWKTWINHIACFS